MQANESNMDNEYNSVLNMLDNSHDSVSFLFFFSLFGAKCEHVRLLCPVALYPVLYWILQLSAGWQHEYFHVAFTSRGECRLLLLNHAKRSTDECGENYTTYSTSNTDKQSKRISVFFMQELEFWGGGAEQNPGLAGPWPCVCVGRLIKTRGLLGCWPFNKSCLLSGPHRGPLFLHPSLPGPL